MKMNAFDVLTKALGLDYKCIAHITEDNDLFVYSIPIYGPNMPTYEYEDNTLIVNIGGREEKFHISNIKQLSSIVT